MNLDEATLEDILKELSNRPIDWVFILAEHTNQFGKSFVCSNLPKEVVVSTLEIAEQWVTNN